MPIVRFSNKFNDVPANAVNVRIIEPGFNMPVREEDMSDFDKKYGRKDFGPYCNITWETHNGFCLRDREANGYHDSDFHMLIWNPVSGSPFEICFATTRGWSYPSYASSVDATPEVLAAYGEWKAAQERRRRISEKLARRAEKIRIARAIGESNYRNLRKLEAVVPGGYWNQTIKLITSTALRSAFRKSLRDQILTWYRNPSPKFPTPLSRKQWEYV